MVADLQALRDAWARSDALFSLLAESTLYEAGIPLRHPFIFYLGHLPAFARNHLAAVLGVQGQEGPLDTLFERGVDPEQALELQAAEAWPAVDEVLAYRDRARAWVGEAVHAVEGTEHAWVLPMIVEHELMHHETLLYMLNRLPVERLNRPEGWEDPPGGSGGGTERVRVGAGAVQLGADPGTVPFGWDNEFPAEVVEVEAFDLDRYPITVGQWLGFVEAGGYREDRWWSDVDRAWRDAQGVRHPDSWRWHEGQWQVRSLLRWHPLSEVMGWPVHLSLAEARAWCRYRGDCRLPTEPELHRAAFTSPDGSEQPPPTRGAFDFAVRGPIPVGKAGTCSRWGVEELIGNGWEWTDTPFLPRPGFRAHLWTYPGYSSDFFDREHFVVFGASWATDRRLVRRSFRNWYRARYPYVFATFRTVLKERAGPGRGDAAGSRAEGSG